MKKRERSVAHLWADKRVIRFFRHNFDKREYRKLRDVYLALCEIDSDFVEEKFNDEKSIRNLTKTCTTYTGMDMGIVNKILQKLKELDLIDYGHKRSEGGKVVGSFLVMFAYDGDDYHKSLIRIDPNMGRPELYIKKDILSRNNKNSSKEEDLISPKGDIYEPDGSGTTCSDSLIEDNLILKRRQKPIEEEFFAFWESLGLSKFQNTKTKSYQNCVLAIKELMAGKFFYGRTVTDGYQDRRFTREEILETIKNFALAAINMDYEPFNEDYKKRLRHISMQTFFYNRFNQNGTPSLFIKYFKNPPKRCNEKVALVKDDFPDITKIEMDMYSKKRKGGIGNFTSQEITKFIRGARKINSFFEVNRKRIDPMFVRTIKDKVELVMNALQWKFPDEYGPGNLCSEYTYDSIMPEYLEKQAVLIS